MASLGHIAVGMAAARWYRGAEAPRWALAPCMVVWSGLSLLPDADVIGFRFGVAYADPWGHRGAAHSLAFSLLLGAAIGRAFFSPAGLDVFLTEGVWFAPLVLYALWPRGRARVGKRL